MTEQEAKHILILYRPGSSYAEDADVAEALALVRQSSQLKQWFDEHCARQQAIATGFKKIAVPEGLKEQILSEQKSQMSGFWPRNPAAITASLAIFATIVVVGIFALRPEWDRLDTASFSNYRTQMVYTALEAYRMDVETNNVDAIHSYLAGQHAVTDWTLPPGLQRAAASGCGVVQWQGNQVSMVCFHSGNQLRPGQKTDMWLFIINRDASHRAPKTTDPVFAKVSDLTTASWSQDGRTYLLALQGDEKFLRSLL